MLRPAAAKLGGVSEKMRKPNAMKLASIAEAQPFLFKNQSKLCFFAQLALILQAKT